MLVLSRKIGEAIMIGNDIEVVILGVRGNRIRLGVVAPPNVSVHRQEVFQRIQHEMLHEVSSDARATSLVSKAG